MTEKTLEERVADLEERCDWVFEIVKEQRLHIPAPLRSMLPKDGGSLKARPILGFEAEHALGPCGNCGEPGPQHKCPV